MTQSPPEAPPNTVALGLGGHVNWGTRALRGRDSVPGRAEGPLPCWRASCGRRPSPPGHGTPRLWAPRCRDAVPRGTPPLRPLGAHAALEALGSYFF